MAQTVVCIVMGSANDWPIMQGAAEMLARFHISYEVTVSSAHRAPQRTAALAHEAAQRYLRTANRLEESLPCARRCASIARRLSSPITVSSNA